MSFFACGCGANSKQKRRAKSMTISELNNYKQKFRFADNELLEFRQRFNFLANTSGLIDKPSFIESMGVLGLDSGAFLSERIFKVMDNDMDGYIKLEEYLGYFDVLIYGTQEEKYELTFKMIDTERKGWFNFEDFYDMIISMLHTWNNITGNNYNILDNKKLAQFLESIYQKFNIRRSDKVSFEDFKKAVFREPELLEIFDYFNEGIIDTVQPLSEFEHQNQALIQELEQLHSKVNQLRTLIRGRGNNLFEEIHTGIQKVNSLRGGRTSVIPPGFLGHSKQEEINNPSGALSPGNFERKPSMLQSLDTKIRRTALFEHIRRDTEEDELPLSVSLSKVRSAVIRQDAENRNRSQRHHTETFENLMKSEELDINGRKHAGSAGNTYSKGSHGKRNTLDRALEATPIRPKKPVFLGNVQTSPDPKDSSSACLTSSNNNVHTQQGDAGTETLHPGQENQQAQELPSLGFDMNKDVYKNNLGVIKEEKTFTVDTLKISEMRTQVIIQQDTGGIPTFGLKLSGEAFPGVLLDSQRPTEELKVVINKEEEGETRKSFDRMQSEHKRAFAVMVEQKVLELEDIDLMQSKMVSEGLTANLRPNFQLEDVKMADSFLVASGESSRYDGPESNSNNTKNNHNNHRRISKSQGPNLKVNRERADSNDNNIKSAGVNVPNIPNTPNTADDERYRQIAMQVDLIAEETLRIMDEIHLKRRNPNKEEKQEVKKIEMMREMTAHNIPKAAKAKTNKKGNFVSFGHQNWNLVLNMMIGIKVAVKSAVERPETLTVKDFKLKYIFELIPKRTGEIKDNYKICTFFDYAPSIFLEIRRLFGIKNEDYLKSIGPESMLNGLIKGSLSTLAELTSSGKSGSFFYYSADGKYTLKTISRDEFHFLRKILTNYYDHLMNNPNTLMIKFFGLHKVRFMKGPQRKTKLYIIIMANVFNTSREIHVRYDYLVPNSVFP